jgi:hypothetical protein
VAAIACASGTSESLLISLCLAKKQPEPKRAGRAIYEPVDKEILLVVE